MTNVPIPVFWICGPPAVGKSTVAWEVFSRLEQARITTGYVDIDQLGMCYPATTTDPERYRLKARGLAAVVDTFRLAGARCVVVSGVVDPVNARADAALLRHADVSLYRLQVRDEELLGRLRDRGWDDELVADSMKEASEAADSDFADVVVDTTGQSASAVGDTVHQHVLDTLNANAASPSTLDATPPATAADGSASALVMLLCGAPATGKSSAGWMLFQSVRSEGVKAGFLDLAQLGFLRPAPSDDPHNHRVKARNVAGLWAEFRAVDARCLILNGAVENAEDIAHYESVLAPSPLITMRLRARRDTVAARIARRATGDGSRLAGDMLIGLPPEAQPEVVEDALSVAVALDEAKVGDVSVDTDDVSPGEVAALVRERADGWPRLG